MFFQVFGDMIYAYNVVIPLLIYQWMFTALYVSNLIFITLAIIAYLNNIDVDFKNLIRVYRESSAPNSLVSYLPLVLVLFAYGLLIITKPDEALIWGVGIIVVLVIIRQILSLNEIKKLKNNFCPRRTT